MATMTDDDTPFEMFVRNLGKYQNAKTYFGKAMFILTRAEPDIDLYKGRENAAERFFNDTDEYQQTMNMASDLFERLSETIKRLEKERMKWPEAKEK